MAIGSNALRNRGIGWDCVHVAIDDASRVALASIAANGCGDTASSFLRATVEHFCQRGIRIERVMTDNGSPYVSHPFRDTCQQLGIRHLRTKPFTPRTNGKAERFIQTSLREWAYAEALHQLRSANHGSETMAAPLQLAPPALGAKLSTTDH